MRKYPQIPLTKEMIETAKSLIPKTRVNRTIASEIDTLTGHLGEFAFAQYFYGDWRKNNVGKNKGESDFSDFEIKASTYPFSENLNLLVREDYAIARKPPFYVQVIIDVQSRQARDIPPNTMAIIGGFATSDEVDNAPKRDFGSKLGPRGGYQCHYIRIGNLQPIEGLKAAHSEYTRNK